MDSSSSAVHAEPQSPVADQRSHTHSRSSPVQAHTGSFVVAQGPWARKWCSGMGLLPCRCRPLLPNSQGTDSTSSPPAENGAEGCLERAQTQQDDRARDTEGVLVARQGHEALTCQEANLPGGPWGHRGMKCRAWAPGNTQLLSLPLLPGKAPKHRH